MKIYDKLVRDRIPEIIENSGNHCEVEVVSEDILNRRAEKKSKSGGFEDNFILKKTW